MADNYICATCGTLALPINSNLVEGKYFVHRGCPLPDAVLAVVKEASIDYGDGTLATRPTTPIR